MKYLSLIGSSFSSHPIFKANKIEEEAIGMSILESLAKNLWFDGDLAIVIRNSKPLEIEVRKGRYTMRTELPFSEREDINLYGGLTSPL